MLALFISYRRTINLNILSKDIQKEKICYCQNIIIKKYHAPNEFIICSNENENLQFSDFIENNKDKPLSLLVGENLADLRQKEKSVKVTAFGNFEVFVNDLAVDFHSSKAKELFALCIDRMGRSVSIEEATTILWENRPFDKRVKKLYNKAVGAISNTFKNYNITDVFYTSRGFCKVNNNAVNCDYYLFLEGDRQSIISFNEEYMSQYSWAEETLAKLTRMAKYYF